MNTDAEKHPTELEFPVTLALTAIVCLLTMHAFGVNTSLHVATASAALVFCSRTQRPTPLELLWRLYKPLNQCQQG